jgi:hypothetical protein
LQKQVDKDFDTPGCEVACIADITVHDDMPDSHSDLIHQKCLKGRSEIVSQTVAEKVAIAHLYRLDSSLV